MHANAVLRPVPGNVVRLSGSNKGLLESWKEIASFFGREVRTVQLWEKHEALPVHRHLHRKQGRIYAYCEELAAWKAASMQRPGQGGLGLRQDARTAAEPGTLRAMPSTIPSRKLGLLPLDLLNDARREDSRSAPLLYMGRAIEDELVVELCRRDLEAVVLDGARETSAGNWDQDRRLWLTETMRRLRLCGVLTGTLRREGSRLRVVMQVHTGDDLRCIWSERFDSTGESVLDAQASLASDISSALPLEKLGLKAPESPTPLRVSAAEDAYALGRFFWSQRNKASLVRAEQYLRRAIELDPSFEPSYAGLADCFVSYSYSRVMPSAVAAAAANRALRPVLQANATDSATLNGIANVMLSCNWDLAAGERNCRKACDQNAYDSRALQLCAMLMIARGHHDDAIRYATEALRIDPLSKVLNNEVGYACYFAGDFEQAVVHIERAIELDPEFVMGYALLGKVEAQRGNWDAALAALEKAVRLSGAASFHLAMLAYAHVRMSNHQQGRHLLATAAASGPCAPYVTLAAVHLALGEQVAALAHLNQAQSASDVEFMALGSDPRFSPMHSMPEFQSLVSSVRSH